MSSPPLPPVDPTRPQVRGPVGAVGSGLPVDRLWSVLPAVPPLRPLLEAMIRVSAPDAARRWSSAAEVGTLLERQVDAGVLRRHLPELLDGVRRQTERSIEAALQAMAALEEGAVEDAALILAREGARVAGSGCPDEGLAWILAASGLAGEARDRMRLLPVWMSEARVARILGDHERARAAYLRVEEAGLQGGDPGLALTATIGLGNLEVDLGRWTRAEALYDRAEALLRKLDPGGRSPRPEGWHLALNRSILARERGGLDEAWEFLRSAEGVARRCGDAGARPILENARGQILLAMGEPEAAEAAFRRALAVADFADARVTIGVNLAEARLEAGQILAAGHAARAAESEALRSGIVTRLPEVYRALGCIVSRSGSPEAFVLFERALAVVEEARLPPVERARILEAWAREEARSGDPASAEARRTEATRIREELAR